MFSVGYVACLIDEVCKASLFDLLLLKSLLAELVLLVLLVLLLGLDECDVLLLLLCGFVTHETIGGGLVELPFLFRFALGLFVTCFTLC